MRFFDREVLERFKLNIANDRRVCEYLLIINLLLFVKPFLKDFQHTSFQHMGMTNKAE